MAEQAAHSAEHIESLLNDWLQVEFTFYNADVLAQELAQRSRAEQDFLLEWTRRISTTNLEIAHRFATRAGELLGRMDWRLIEAWARLAMDTYDRVGLRPALLVIENVENYAQSDQSHVDGALYEDIDTILLTFARGLSGRALKLAQGEQVYTDSETLFLPAVVAKMETAEDNFILAKSMVAFMWAQTRYGSFRPQALQQLLNHPDAERAQRTFHFLETLRLEARLKHELPGLYREMQRLKTQRKEQDLSSNWLDFAEKLSAPKASVEDSLQLLDAAMQQEPVPHYCYQGEMKLDAVLQIMKARLEREKILLRIKLAELAKEAKATEQEQPGQSSAEPSPPQFQLKDEDEEITDASEMELTLDGAPIAPPEDVKQLLTSIKLDLGQIPDEYLVAAGEGEYDPSLYLPQEKDPNDVWQGTYHEEGADLYDEWDFGRQNYRKNWCVMREKSVTPVYDDFVAQTRDKYAGLVKHLRRSFEAMRDENKLFKRQANGDEVDIDALIEALADANDGSEMTDRLFTRMHRAERNIAVMFMVDMSGSTRGWINDAERESLILLCEALEALGDRYAIYGFSGQTRKRCELYKIKEIDEPYTEEVRARISGIRPQDYTRMGFAIRHLTKLLKAVEARTKLLITISDGKPDDYFDIYRGQYGIEDTRQALVEAKRAGIHSFCITIDKEARDYLPHMYGAAHYAIIDEVKRLPLKVADIYRRLTT